MVRIRIKIRIKIMIMRRIMVRIIVKVRIDSVLYKLQVDQHSARPLTGRADSYYIARLAKNWIE